MSLQSQWFNRGKRLALQWAFRKESIPTTLYMALLTDAIAPAVNMKTLGQLQELAAGNGYTSGGIAVPMSVIGFDAVAEDDSGDFAYVQVKDMQWSASGGTIPASGNQARYAALTTDEGTIASRQLIAWWDFGQAITTFDGQSLVLINQELRLIEPS